MPGAGGDSVKVAVRVRPFNQRERNAGSKCIISMEGKSTQISNPANGETKTFTFDHSYWSHDGFIENKDSVLVSESPNSKYSDQFTVYTDLGKGVLDNAWQGYNAALFAYGQTGSGKSYSMIGYSANKGIVPITCGELFKAIDKNTDKNKQLRVSFSMLEIYNEQVKDLLSKSKQQAGGLKVRQNPKVGFYVEGLKLVPVRAYKEIERLMEQGTYNRTTASTNMNATSSRSHMVITIKFEQVFLNALGQSTTKTSEISLVDLAGSERANATGATGDRLKEGSVINQSLSCLGNVISALADLAQGKKKVIVPYRDSVLTKLLQAALGGNSRTIMIAALSPADINYDETLSTLRYADRAKKIQNKAVVNESPTDRLIRELKAENAKLMSLLQKQQKGGQDEDKRQVEQQLTENQRKMMEFQLSWEQRLEDARSEWEKEFKHSGETYHEWEQHPHIMNVNEDPQLTGVIKHAFYKDQFLIGKAGSKDVSIGLKGLGIQSQHAVIKKSGGHVTIQPCSGHTQVIINGRQVKQEQTLKHLDRIKLGSNSLFLFVGFPKERQKHDQIEKYTFDYFMTELAEHQGFAAELQTPELHDSDEEHVAHVVFQDFIDLMPVIAEANALSEEFKKNVKFEAELKSHSSHDTKGKAKEKEVIVRVTNTKTKKVWIWTKEKFLHRKNIMDELYLGLMEGRDVSMSKDKDPFWDPVENIYLGSCHIWLQSLCYCIEIDEHFTLHNYHGKEEAVVQVQLIPCDTSGQPLGEDAMVLEPSDLLGKPFDFTLTLSQCMGLRWVMEDNSRGVLCKIRFYGKSELVETRTVWGNPFAHLAFKMHYSFKMDKSFLHYLQSESLVLELWGAQTLKDKVIRSSEAPNDHHDDLKHELQIVGMEDITKQLVQMQEDLEEIADEKDTLKRENFRLRRDLDKQKQAVKLAKMGKNTNSAGSPRKNSVSSMLSMEPLSPNPTDATVGLDVDLAKALKVFFKDVKTVQHQLSEIRNNVSEAQDGKGNNGHIKMALKQQEEKLKSTEENLSGCLQTLKHSISVTIKKSKSSDPS